MVAWRRAATSLPGGSLAQARSGVAINGEILFQPLLVFSSLVDHARVPVQGHDEKEVMESAGTLCLELASSSTGDKAQSPGG